MPLARNLANTICIYCAKAITLRRIRFWVRILSYKMVLRACALRSGRRMQKELALLATSINGMADDIRCVFGTVPVFGSCSFRM